MHLQKATFAGGKFWCMIEPFATCPGVEKIVAGYIGEQSGTIVSDDVQTEYAEHFEAVEIHYDEHKICYAELLDTFWRHIDPTDDGGQFENRGNAYRTAIFYHNGEQLRLARYTLDILQNSGRFANLIVTNILPATTFDPIEEFNLEELHQDSAWRESECFAADESLRQRKEYLEKTWRKAGRRLSVGLSQALLAVSIFALAVVYAIGSAIWIEANRRWPSMVTQEVDTTSLDEWEFDRILSAEEIIADALELVQLVEDIHPIFIEEPPPGYVLAKDVFLQSSSVAMSREEFWLTVAYYMASLGDQRTVVGRGRRLDLEIPMHWEDDNLIISQDGVLPKGAKVHFIAGVPVANLLPVIDKAIPYENESGFFYNRNTYVTRQYMHVAAGAEKSSSVTIAYEVQGLLGEVNIEYKPPSRNAPPKSFTYESLENDTIALVTSLFLHNDANLTQTLDALKAAIAHGTRKVIIDVRNNIAGGVPSACDRIFKAMNMVPNRYGFTYRYTPTLVSKIKEYRGKSGVLIKEPDNTFTNKSGVELILLVNEKTEIAGTILAAMIHDAGVGTIVGSEPTIKATQYAYPLYFRLQHSEFVVTISHIKCTRPNPELDKENQGLVDVLVSSDEDALEVAIAMFK